MNGPTYVLFLQEQAPALLTETLPHCSIAGDYQLGMQNRMPVAVAELACNDSEAADLLHVASALTQAEKRFRGACGSAVDSASWVGIGRVGINHRCP